MALSVRLTAERASTGHDLGLREGGLGYSPCRLQQRLPLLVLFWVVQHWFDNVVSFFSFLYGALHSG